MSPRFEPVNAELEPHSLTPLVTFFDESTNIVSVTFSMSQRIPLSVTFIHEETRRSGARLRASPALFSILFAAFAWATDVFQWLWSLATWLFSGAWRGGGEVCVRGELTGRLVGCQAHSLTVF